MPPPLLAVTMEALAAGFGGVVAILCVGVLVLRWYRLRHEFLLMKIALEKGTMQLPPTQPQWLLSLRQGAMIVTLGISLGLVGGAGWWMASQIPRPSDAGGPVDVDPGPPAPGERPRPPRPPDPAREAWDRAQRQQLACMAIVGGGGILVLLGSVKLMFVPIEKRLLQ